MLEEVQRNGIFVYRVSDQRTLPYGRIKHKSKYYLFRKVTAQAEEAGKGRSGAGSKPAGPGKASGLAPSNKAAFRATLWTNLDQVNCL